MSGEIDAVVLLAILIGIPALLAYLDRPRHGRRYSGSVYDPQLRLRVSTQADKSGMRSTHAVQAAVRVGNTGRICGACGATTFGYSPRCGRCGFENVSTTPARPSPLKSERLSLSPQEPDIAPPLAMTSTATVHPSSPSSWATTTGPIRHGEHGRLGGGSTS